MERPSGVSSARLAISAASARVRSVMPVTGMNSAAMRLPKVMVPVLSSSSVSTSPAASTARPEVATTLKRISRSMPAMPIADGGRDQCHKQRDQHRHGEHRAGIAGEEPQRDADDEEDQGKAGK